MSNRWQHDDLASGWGKAWWVLAVLGLVACGCGQDEGVGRRSATLSYLHKIEAGLVQEARGQKWVEALVVVTDPPVGYLNRPVANMVASPRRPQPMAPSGQLDYAVWLHRRNAAVGSIKKRVFNSVPRDDFSTLREYPSFNATYVRMTHAGLLALARHPDVLLLHKPRRYSAALADSLPLIGANKVHAMGTGNLGLGTSVAVLDTGCDYKRTAFGSCTAPGGTCKVAFAKDFTTLDDGILDDPLSPHGTNVSAIVLGVAPSTKILALDVFTGQEPQKVGANQIDTMSALQWVITNKAKYNIVAANMSLGGGKYQEYCSSDYYGYLKTLYSAGVIPVIAAGNDAYDDAVASPGCSPWGMTVGAVYDDWFWYQSWSNCSDVLPLTDQVACFSNSQRMVDILAPGPHTTAGGATMGGTSQATPHVAGAVALVRGNSWGQTLSTGMVWDLLRFQGKRISDSKAQGNVGLMFTRLDVESVFTASRVDWDYINTMDHRKLASVPTIPDGTSAELADTISFGLPGTKVDKLYVALHVAHPWISDLSISLEGPDKTKVPLHVLSTHGSRYNLTPIYGVTEQADLARFHGKPLAGTWTLRIRDNWKDPGAPQQQLFAWSIMAKTCTNCAQRLCGNMICETGETYLNCPSDCGTLKSGCGDKKCDYLTESCTRCPADCGTCSYCGDSVCGLPESCFTCPLDCGQCADGGVGPADAGVADMYKPDAAQSSCGQVPSAGCCKGSTLYYCLFNTVSSLDCSKSPSCGWNASYSYYDCNTSGAADPSGLKPKNCPGGLPDAGVVPDKGTPASDASAGCYGVSVQGCCYGTTLFYCVGGTLSTVSCQNSPSCGWNVSSSFYDCGTAGTADPSGMHPMTCPFVKPADAAVPDQPMPLDVGAPDLSPMPDLAPAPDLFSHLDISIVPDLIKPKDAVPWPDQKPTPDVQSPPDAPQPKDLAPPPDQKQSVDAKQKKDKKIVPDLRQPDAKREGREGGPCFPNKTCMKGLTCLSNLCVRVPDSGKPPAPVPESQDGGGCELVTTQPLSGSDSFSVFFLFLLGWWRIRRRSS